MSLGFVPHVAKPRNTLLERADRIIERVDRLRVEVVTKQDENEARRRRLDLQAGLQRRPR